ncbi:MAG: hypothetical protein AAF633_26755, partial [Chloroflexota bacterium]
LLIEIAQSSLPENTPTPLPPSPTPASSSTPSATIPTRVPTATATPSIPANFTDFQFLPFIVSEES